MTFRTYAPLAVVAALLFSGPVSGPEHATAQAAQPAAGTPTTTPTHFLVTFVSIGSGGECTSIYTVPPNKVLIPQSVSMYTFTTGSANSIQQMVLYNDACTGIIDADVTTLPAGSVNHTFGAGIAVAGGKTVSAKAVNTSGSMNLVGYLIPSDGIKIVGQSSSSGSTARDVLLKP